MDNSMKHKHRAIGLVGHSELQAAIATLLPDYIFHWGLAHSKAINTAAYLRPSFMVVDIEDDTSQWKTIALGLQSNPATRRIPMLAIASNNEGAMMRIAAEVNLNGPIPYDALKTHLPSWVERRARVWDADYYESLGAMCDEPLPPLAQKGIQLFNEHQYWDAHEALEEAWIEVRPAPIGEVYRSILQVGVAYYQIQRGNYRGAVKMFLRAVQWLDPLPDTCQGVDIAQFKQDAAAARTAMEELGAERLQEFDTALFKPVPMKVDT